MKRLLDYLAALWHDRRGSVGIELGAALPVLMIFVITGTEFTRFMLLNLKLDRAATTVADLVSQEETITEAEVAGIFDAVAPILNPFPWGASGVMIVTSISQVNGATTVNWQRSFGSMGASSQMGGGGAGLPTLTDGENIIVGETYYSFTTWFPLGPYANSLVDQQLYHRAYYRTRIGTLAAVAPI